jgi:hypothetical protein
MLGTVSSRVDIHFPVLSSLTRAVVVAAWLSLYGSSAGLTNAACTGQCTAGAFSSSFVRSCCGWRSHLFALQVIFVNRAALRQRRATVESVTAFSLSFQLLLHSRLAVDFSQVNTVLRGQQRQ